MQLGVFGVQWTIHSQKYFLLITPTLYSSEVSHWSAKWRRMGPMLNMQPGQWEPDLWRVQLRFVQIPSENTATDNIEPTGCERGQHWGHVRLQSRCCPARPKAHMARPPQRTSPLFSNKSLFEIQLLTRASHTFTNASVWAAFVWRSSAGYQPKPSQSII